MGQTEHMQSTVVSNSIAWILILATSNQGDDFKLIGLSNQQSKTQSY